MTPEEKTFYQWLSLLRLYYSKLLKIIEAFCGAGSYIAWRNESLNGMYTILKNFIEKILERGDFQELAKNYPALFESLIGDIEDADMVWEISMSKEAYAFLGKIEKLYVLSGSPQFQLTPELESMIKSIDSVIAAHKEEIKRSFQRFMEAAEKNKHLFGPETGEQKPKSIQIKNIRLDERGYYLDINNGEKIVSFKKKREKEGLEKETKQFKILVFLWDYRYEMRGSRNVRIDKERSDVISVENLYKNSSSKSIEATKQHIKRLNTLFKKEGLPVEIEGKEENYRLIIHKV
jgi:sulfur relay (sulfurtransferase) DsrC/TusE family protein